MTPFRFRPRSETGYVERKNETIDMVLDCFAENKLVDTFRAPCTVSHLVFIHHDDASFQCDGRDIPPVCADEVQRHNRGEKSGTRRRSDV